MFDPSYSKVTSGVPEVHRSVGLARSLTCREFTLMECKCLSVSNAQAYQPKRKLFNILSYIVFPQIEGGTPTFSPTTLNIKQNEGSQLTTTILLSEHAGCHYAECIFGECCFAEWPFAKCHYIK